jgi:hypothetical protein
LLAGSPLGVTEAIMLAHGFTMEMLDALVRDGLATAEQREMRAGRQPIKVVWLTITDIGRQALAGRRRRGRHCGRRPTSLSINPSSTARFRFFAWHDHVMIDLSPQG